MRTPAGTRILALLATALAACSEQPSAPSDQASLPPAAPELAPVKFWDAGAAAAWNEQATVLAFTRVINSARLYAYLSLAQFRAAQAAQAIQPHPPIEAAIGAASVVVLSAFFPLDVTTLEAALDAQEAAAPWPGAKHADFAAGEAIGRAVGTRVMAWAASDGVGLTNPGVAPTGPGFWIPPSPPATPARGGLGARPFYLSSADEFRPGPPPAFGSAEFLAALAEVRQVADNRTAEQIAIANFWNVNQSSRSSAAMNRLAIELIKTYRRQDADAARILFLLNSGVYDAEIGCFDAKYHYWFIRPNQADPGIITLFPQPFHPSYPSGHACRSGVFAEVLSAEFPSERERIEQIAEEASVSRLYAGIHYRFDMAAGLALGRAVGRKALAADLDAVAIQ
jgi:PAP2 superfamily